MAEYEMTLMDRQRVARNTMAFWFDANGAHYEFRAGQHADFVFSQPFVNCEGDNSRTFSLANSPHDNGLLRSSGVSDDEIETEEFGDYKQDSLPNP